MTYAYSPHTGEIINTSKIADWMGTTEIEPPAFDKTTQSCFFENGAWVVRTAEPEPTPVPDEVTPAQGLMALYMLKSITEDQILGAIESIEDPGEKYQAQIAYNKATVWQRKSPTMQTLSTLLNLTNNDLDDLFIAGATIEA